MSRMKKIKKARFALPNLVTLGSVFCSFLSMTFALNAQSLVGPERLDSLTYAALAILGSIVFDLFDGKVARWTNTCTKFGMELDSLADGVSFGVTPAILIYSFALSQLRVFGLIACFIFVSGALLRLARFNIEAPDEGVQTYFKGIPAPGGAACVTSVVLMCLGTGFVHFTHSELILLACAVIGFGLLMVSNIKYKTLKGKKTKYDYIYIAVGLLFFGAMWFFKTLSIAFFALVCYFVVFGILNTIYLNLTKNPHRRKRRKSDDALEDSEDNAQQADDESVKSADDPQADEKKEDKSNKSDDNSKEDKSDDSSKEDKSDKSDDSSKDE